MGKKYEDAEAYFYHEYEAELCVISDIYAEELRKANEYRIRKTKEAYARYDANLRKVQCDCGHPERHTMHMLILDLT